jgi:hypothetical protein
LIRKYRDERWLKAHTDDISEPNLYADELAELPYPLDYGNQIGKMPARQHVRTTKKVINKKLGKNVIFAIEIIASVLGIISFYLDYLR